jgi:hypothetical protein
VYPPPESKPVYYPPTPKPVQPKVDCIVDVALICKLAGGTPCSAAVGRYQDCLTTFNYSIEIHNLGTVEMLVDTDTFVYEGTTVDVLSRVNPNPLFPGERAFVYESRQVDLCQTNSVDASVTVRASPPYGDICQATDSLSIIITPLPPPPTPRPTYPSTKRPAPKPTPRPTYPSTRAPTRKPVKRPTYQPTKELEVPCYVDVELECKLSDGRACNLITPRTSNCIETFYYDIDIVNTGAVSITMTDVTFTFNTQNYPLVGDIPRNPLFPGETTGVNPRIEVNACTPISFEAKVVVKASSSAINSAMACSAVPAGSAVVATASSMVAAAASSAVARHFS